MSQLTGQVTHIMYRWFYVEQMCVLPVQVVLRGSDVCVNCAGGSMWIRYILPVQVVLRGSDVCYLYRWFYVDPGRQHHARVQRLCSDSEVNDSSTVDRPDVLTAAAHTDQANTSFNTQVTFYLNTPVHIVLS